jgi:hypothetical protein
VHCTRDVVKLWTGKLRDRPEVKGSAQLADDSVQVLMTYDNNIFLCKVHTPGVQPTAAKVSPSHAPDAHLCIQKRTDALPPIHRPRHLTVFLSRIVGVVAIQDLPLSVDGRADHEQPPSDVQ